MSLRWFVYYCAAWAGFAGFIGWSLGKTSPIESSAVFNAAVKGMLLGLTVALMLVLVDLAFNGSGREGCGAVLRPLVGGCVGALGGFVGGMLGQILYALWGPFLLVGWGLTGLLIGAAPGMYEWLSCLAADEDASGAARKVRNGVIGGLMGGLLGGGFFLWMQTAWAKALADRIDEFWSPAATGFVVLGMCIGLLMGLTQVILTDASIKVESGFRAGRELILTRAETTVGRGEACDVGLFGDPAIEKLHLRIVQKGGQYFVEDNGTKEGTFVNGEEVRGSRPLRDGDLIEVGRATLRFSERARRVEGSS